METFASIGLRREVPSPHDFCPEDYWKTGGEFSYNASDNSATDFERDLVSWFNERAERWEYDAAIHSSPSATYIHRDYMAIIGMGIMNPRIIIPMIFKRIPNTGSDWFYALEIIANGNPAENEEDFDAAMEAWHDWWVEKYL